MLERKNSIVWLAAWVDACALWREYMPYLNTPGSSFFCFDKRPNFDLIAGNDVCVVQRCCTRPQLEFLRVVRGLGMKIIYDLDDNMWEIPDFNPAKEILDKYRDGFVYCMQMVDAVVVSTARLGKIVRRHMEKLGSVPVFVAENKLDTRLFVPPQHTETTIVGWAGSSSHSGDLALMTDAIHACALESPETLFEFRGMKPDGSLEVLPNFRFSPWTPVAEFPNRMPLWGWSIGLAPLVDNSFNASKSNIKMLECAYMGVPCLASWVEPYVRFASYDPELRWLLCAGRSAWTTKLRDLIHDNARREHLGMKMQRVLHEHYTYERPHEGWQTALGYVRSLPSPG